MCVLRNCIAAQRDCNQRYFLFLCVSCSFIIARFRLVVLTAAACSLPAFVILNKVDSCAPCLANMYITCTTGVQSCVPVDFNDRFYVVYSSCCCLYSLLMSWCFIIIMHVSCMYNAPVSSFNSNNKAHWVPIKKRRMKSITITIDGSSSRGRRGTWTFIVIQATKGIEFN